MGYALEIKNLSKSYKDFKLDDISINIEKGYIMGFIGENGAGKTTTIKLIMNLLNKDSGTISVFGMDNVKNEKVIKEDIGFVYDECFYYETLTVEENAKIVSKFYKNWSWSDFDKYIKKFEVSKKKKINELSKGMKMKFALAVALSHKAKFIILDEPTSGLDPVVRNEVLDILYEAIQDGETSVLISTHITSDLERVADYITYINKGKIVFSKEKDEVLDKYKIIKGSKEALTAEVKKCFIGLRESRFGFEGLTNDVNKVKSMLDYDIVVDNSTLDDIMVFYKNGVK